ncbi:MAG: HAMP domain-containing histidine kinase [Gammaproteobacteria bacterium]|nr:HAMP domain-containing histidine kinase [Gammaproteobacteria bacterium]
MTSLRSKILTTYGLFMIALLGFVGIVFVDLYYQYTHISEGEAVYNFYAASQELRREEKNLFLYRDNNGLKQLQSQLDAAQNALNEGQRVFAEIASQQELQQISVLLNRYRKELINYPQLTAADRTIRQQKIRTTGQALSELTRDFNQRQHAILSNTTRVVVWTLLAASITVILLGIVSALFIVRQVVRPLSQLEKQLDEFGETNEQTLTQISNDKEIQSFVHHFNSMLDRLRTQQNQFRHHEKAVALGVLVSGVAHELNNPLSNISTSVQLLLEDDGSGREDLRRQWLSHVDSETERARRIVRRLLDTVRQPEMHMQIHTAADLVQSAVMLIHRLLPPTILLHIEDVPDSPLLVERERIQQVFINLIKNAVDAGATNIDIVAQETSWSESMPANTDYLVGEINNISQSHGVLMFHIDDDGPGIPKNHLAQIFDPFFTTKSGGEGTGLGLYMVAEIISEHDGCMSVENRDQGGTRFSIWLPLVDTEKNEMEHTQSAEEAS